MVYYKYGYDHSNPQYQKQTRLVQVLAFNTPGKWPASLGLHKIKLQTKK